MNVVTFNTLVWCWILLAVIIFFVLLFVKAPYGRHSSRKWGITLSNRWGWFLMEIPSSLVFLYFYLTGDADKNAVTWIIAALFLLHYGNRSLVFPFRIRTKGKSMPLIIMLMALFFNLVNGSFLGYYLGTLQTLYSHSWMSDYRFIAGILLFFAGMILNVFSDETLILMRKNSSEGYLIPRGGLFTLVSCPNFFGEIIEWLGYAVLCWSLPALSFFIWTCCNLIPRALDHHRWYRRVFPDYPVNRKAVFPWLL
jgi:glycosyltransferase involved in cell wall biosynthesis